MSKFAVVCAHLRRPGSASGRQAAVVAVLAMVAAAGGCARYDPLPLPQRPDLAAGLAGLASTIPAAGVDDPARRIDTAKPLTIDDIGLLAILNDPDLKTERGTLGAARAGIVQASLLPNPAATFSYGALVTGPGTASAVGGSLAQDIAALVTRGARVKSAQAKLGQTDADLLWQEWQVAQKARQLAIDIAAADRAIALTRHQHGLIARDLRTVRKAVAAGNLTLAAEAPLLAAAAAAEQSLTSLELDRLKNWQALDALLGLMSEVRFAIARPQFGPLPRSVDRLIADLPRHRPDLAALRLGYDSAEEDVRAAVLGQFPAFSLGATYGSDTTGVVSAGPTFTFGLPVFDRNQGQIAKSRATREVLREQYRARLDSAVANAHGLVAQLRRLMVDLAAARKASASAASIAGTARRAYGAANLDQRSLTDYETTALERALQVVAIERQIGEDRVFLAVELGLGLPQTRIALAGAAPR